MPHLDLSDDEADALTAARMEHEFGLAPGTLAGPSGRKLLEGRSSVKAA
jgi:hypothetical protein